MVDYSRVSPPCEASAEISKGPVDSIKRGSHAPTVKGSGPHPPSKKRGYCYKFGDDSLGKLVLSSVHHLHSSPTWASYVASTRGQSHLSPDLERLPHPASRLLVSLRDHGMPVITGTTGWSDADFDARLQRGSHTSTRDHVDFVRDEMADFARKGFWTVLPYEAVRDLRRLPGFRHLRSLRVSPLGCVPQRGRRPRLIVDLSFYGVNADTVKLAPHEAMQFGRTLERLLFRIRHANPRYGPVYMNKIDISDGFYRVALAAASSPKLAIVLPTRPGEPTLLAIPLSLPMGWIESPPAFCAVTETIADLANWRLPRRYAPLHRLDQFADTPPPVEEAEVPPHDVDTSGPCAQGPCAPFKAFPSVKAALSSPGPSALGPCAPVKAFPSVKAALSPPGPSALGRCASSKAFPSVKVALSSPVACPSLPAVPRMPAPLPAADVPSRQPHALPLSYTDVYVDDFCNLVQGNARRRRIARRILFHAIDEVIRPLDPFHEFHQEPISIKKLLKGDGCWGTSKLLLGWLIDTVQQTLELPPHRYDRLCAIFDDLGAENASPSRPGNRSWVNSAAWCWLSRAVVAFSAPFKPASSIPIGTVYAWIPMSVPSSMISKPLLPTSTFAPPGWPKSFPTFPLALVPSMLPNLAWGACGSLTAPLLSYGAPLSLLISRPALFPIKIPVVTSPIVISNLLASSPTKIFWPNLLTPANVPSRS